MTKKIVIEDAMPTFKSGGLSTSFLADAMFKAYLHRNNLQEAGMFAYVSWKWVNPFVRWIGKRKVLEVMAGAGYLTYALREKGVDVIATDNKSWYEKRDKKKAKNSNLKHRPIGLGLMGFQDVLYKLNIPYGSQQAVDFADESMEYISYYAISSSVDLAAERGSYETYPGSLLSQGILPIDSIKLLKQHRGGYVDLDESFTLDWESLRQKVKTIGMRNSNTMAIAPTATISNICGVSQSIEPTYQNLFVKSNLSGEFTVINPHLVAELKQYNLWDEVMVNDLKYYNGSIAKISRVSEKLKQIYATAFEVDPTWLIEAGSRRQK